MKRLLLIGIGAGDPEHVTMQAVRALNEVDVFFVLDKGPSSADLNRIREEICMRYIDRPYRVAVPQDPVREARGVSYEDDVLAWHAARADLFESLLTEAMADGETAAFLVWGDPSLYDSTIRIVDQVVARGTVDLTVEVIPGVSSVQLLAARHGIALHAIGRPVQITTGRELAKGWPDGVDDVVVMLDGRQAFADVDPDGVHIFWGAYLGTEDEILVAGPLAEVTELLLATRATARERKGWMFDIYLLRRTARVEAHVS